MPIKQIRARARECTPKLIDLGFNEGSDYTPVEPKQKQRLVELINHLQGDMPLREFADAIGINHSSIVNWLSQKGGIGAKGRQALADYLKRSVQDLVDYLDEKYTLLEFLDPQFKLEEQISSFNVDNVSSWIQYRANLDEKLRLLNELIQQVGGIARDKSTTRLRRSLQALLDSGEYDDLKQIAEQVGLKPDRLDKFYRGESLPCEDEITALSPLLPDDVEELRRLYVTGV
jgi:transcriptional regulator with XRE-family HTH domain